MAQPTNTYDTFDLKGAIEDIEGNIYNISPEETPFLTACAKLTATNSLHEWQTDALRASAVNAHIPGDDTVATARTATTRLGNYTQVFKDAVTISDNEASTKKAGRGGEMVYQTAKMMAEVKKDVEKSLFANQARVAGSSIAAPYSAGLGAWINTNTNFQSGSSGADPTGDGTLARVDDGVPTAFSQTKFDSVMQQIWVSGGKPDVCYLSSFQMNVALGFTGNNAQRSNVVATDAKVVKHMALYITPWGTMEFKPIRENRARDVFLLQSDMWAVAVKRPMKSTELAKTGDSEKRQILTELCLVSRNEAASGGVFDNTVS